MGDRSRTDRLPRFRRPGVVYALTCASGLVVGAVATAVVTALAGALTPGDTSARAGLPSSAVVGALLGLAVFTTSMAVYAYIVAETPRVARWGAAVWAAGTVLLLSVSLRGWVTWSAAVLAAVAALALYVLSPRLAFRRA